mmetsp:Transcript_99338/g.289912  ORF Transcript_99338/g.289912 Transcript_99338/m.289912 type:complete len:366 (-) Transcript_99338:85-1182(-)
MVEQRVEVAIGITLWYLTSFGTLLLNKHILGTLHVQPNTLAVVQMVSTAIYGALKTLSLKNLSQRLLQVLAAGKAGADGKDLEDPASRKGHKASGWQRSLGQMGLVGAMRFATVVLGLVSLKHVAASFTETIKASAPFFTVIVAYLMLGETTTLPVIGSLIPVAGGLVMVSYSELSFNVIGFSAAVATNVIECVQNVFSKRLLAREYTASQLQFYTSLTALALQAPLMLLTSSTDAAPVTAAPLQMGLVHNATATVMEPPDVFDNATGAGPGAADLALSHRALAILWVDGVLYHLQSVVAYVVMSYLSPVTVSVVNTLKRALLIWISVLVFGNPVTPLAQLGTAVCLLGALWYNVARQASQSRSK